MSRIVFVAFILVSVFIVGCTEDVKDDPRFRVDPAQAKIAADEGFATPLLAEVDLVEQMIALRNKYRASLRTLSDYYVRTGDTTKRRWAEKELASPQYRYLMPAEVITSQLRATNSIPAADELFAEAERLYRKAWELLVIANEDLLRQALSKFNLLISNHPTSDKIDDASYIAARIYEHFKDYQIAAVYFQRAFQWDPDTPHPARFRAAYVLDRNLNMRDQALTLYRLACQKEANYESNIEFAKTRIIQMTKPKSQPETKTGSETPKKD